MRHRKMKFRPEYLELLRSGRKRTTIRLEKKYGLGETVYIADTNGKIYGKAVVEDIVEKSLEKLSERDALIDGFESLEELRTILRDIYGDLPSDTKVYIYHLKILSWNESRATRSSYRSRRG